jgi:dolichyl-phosphate beta-glucosyltransferase
LICVLDGCEDLSRIVIRDTCARHAAKMKRCEFAMIDNARNFGKGRSVRQGMMASRGRLALFTDADLSTPIEELDTMLPLFAQGWDVVIGSRGVVGADVRVRQNIVRQTMGKSFNLCVRLLTGLRFHDTQCGFKCFTRDVARALFSRAKSDGFAFDVELLYLAAREGLRVREVPVRWENSPASKVRMVRDSLAMLGRALHGARQEATDEPDKS